MPFESSVSAPPLQWDVVVNWPTLPANINPLNATLLGTRMGFGSQGVGSIQDPDSLSENQPLGFEQFAAGGLGSDSMNMEDDIFCWALKALGVGASRNNGWWGWPMVPKIIQTNAALSPGVVTPSWTRVFWVSILFKLDGNNFGLETGIAMTQFVGPWGNPPWFNQIAAIQPGGFGIVGNGLGTGFNYVSYTPGVVHPAGLIESVAIPPATMPMGAWNTIEFIILNSAPSRNASMICRANGTTVVTRNWIAGPGQLPVYAPTAPGIGVGYELRQQFADPGGGGGDFYTARVTARLGRFTPDGLELTD